MNSRLRIAWTVLLVSGLAAAGCSAVGFGIGYAIDASRAQGERLYREELRALERGDDIVVRYGDGYRVAGQFRGLSGSEDGEWRALELKTAGQGEIRQVPRREVGGVTRYARTLVQYRWLGLGIGAALDVTAIVTVAALWSSQGLGGGGGWGVAGR